MNTNRSYKAVSYPVLDNRKEIFNSNNNSVLEMNNILFEYYSNNKAITIAYTKNGSTNFYSGIIWKIDILNQQIIFLPKKKFSMNNINRIIVK